MGCALASTKYFIFFFNVLFVILSILIILIASVFLKIVEPPLSILLIVILVFGCIVFLVSFAGCFGAIRENVCLIWTYVGFLITFAIITAIILSFVVTTDDAKHNAYNQINFEWEALMRGNSKLIDRTQKNLKCCGKQNAHDYIAANLTIPESCYHSDYGQEKILNQMGCYRRDTDEVINMGKYLRFILWPLLISEVIGAALGIVLGMNFCNTGRRSKYSY